MTTEEAKKEVVRKAYGEYYEACQPDENGWTSRGRIAIKLFSLPLERQETLIGSLYRPKSLKGLEDNNGWIRIEPDGSNLPEQKEWMYQVISKKAGYCLAPFVNGTPVSTPEYWLKHFTHWKPIEKSEPIY